MKPLQGRSRALLEAARPAEQPTGVDRRRVHAGVMAKIAAAGVVATAVGAAGSAAANSALPAAAGAVTALAKGPAAAAGTTAAGAVTAGAAATSGLMKAILLGAFAGLCVVAAVEVVERSSGSASSGSASSGSAESSAVPVVPSAPLTAPAGEDIAARIPTPVATHEAPSAPSLPEGAPAEPRSTRAEPRAEAELKGAGTASVREELALLKEAQQAIHAGETERALSLLETHAGRFELGAFKEERLAARAIALCNAGRGAEARQAVGQFLAGAKASQLEPRVRAACAGAMTGAPGTSPSKP